MSREMGNLFATLPARSGNRRLPSVERHPQGNSHQTRENFHCVIQFKLDMQSTPPKRFANTRRDSGESSRDARRERERNASQPGETLLPGQWVRRGIQPEVPPRAPSAIVSLLRLASEIEEERDPVTRARLQTRYRGEAAALADLATDIYEGKLLAVHAEIVAALAPIAAPIDPADMTRQRWQTLHKALLVARRRAAQWITVSRHFAVERWGSDFVTAAEATPTT